MTAPNPHEIAAKLTKAQVRALKTHAALQKAPLLATFMKDARRMLGSLVKLGLLKADDEYPGIKYQTPLGRAVLAALDAKEPK